MRATTKNFKCIDPIYNFDELKPFISEDVEFGNDCIYRAINVQAKLPHLELDVRFGAPYFLGHNPGHLTAGRYYSPYQWHAWVEDDNTIYDSCDAFTLNSTPIDPKKVLVITDIPSFANCKNTPERALAILDFFKKTCIFWGNKPDAPDVILFEGITIADAGYGPYIFDHMADAAICSDDTGTAMGIMTDSEFDILYGQVIDRCPEVYQVEATVLS